jgi:hypothetical protein
MPGKRGTKRPWKVFVHDIGPTFSYATEVRARERAQDLVSPKGPDCYGKVTVYDVFRTPIQRTLYQFEKEPVEQVLRGGAWHDA